MIKERPQRRIKVRNIFLSKERICGTCDSNKKKRKEILEAGALPVPVKAAIYQRDGFKTVVFDLVEE